VYFLKKEEEGERERRRRKRGISLYFKTDPSYFDPCDL
jgi:hypothetical protein